MLIYPNSAFTDPKCCLSVKVSNRNASSSNVPAFGKYYRQNNFPGHQTYKHANRDFYLHYGNHRWWMGEDTKATSTASSCFAQNFCPENITVGWYIATEDGATSDYDTSVEIQCIEDIAGRVKVMISNLRKKPKSCIIK